MGKTIETKVSSEILRYDKLIDELADINETLELCSVSISTLVFKYFHAETNLGVLSILNGAVKRLGRLYEEHLKLLDDIRIKIDGKPRRTSKPSQNE